MEPIEVKEALNTAILLGEVAQSCHSVEIDGIGEVRIDGGKVLLLSAAGEWKRITRENMEQRLEELMQESFEERVKRSIGTLVFNT
jgi:hypothetical protein